jgi:hypothetical protein
MANAADYQTLYVLAHGDGEHVLAAGNTYTSVGTFPNDGNLGPVPQTALIISGNWYRVYWRWDGSCFPWDGGCYPSSSVFLVAREDAGRFDAGPPNYGWALGGSVSRYTLPVLYGSGYVDIWGDPRQVNSPSLGSPVTCYLSASFNAGNVSVEGRVWILDLGPGDESGPYLTPPPPVDPLTLSDTPTHGQAWLRGHVVAL